MNWIILSIFAYFLNAIVSVVDKILVSKRIPDPLVYSIYVGLLSITVLFLTPFGFFLPPVIILIPALLSGIIFLFALFFLFTALYKGEASRIFTVVGATTPFFLLCFSFLFLGEKLSSGQIIAFIFLLIGGILIGIGGKKFLPKLTVFRLPVLAAFLFAISLTLTKFVFIRQPFFNGFIWTRLGSFLAALLFLIPKAPRERILKVSRKTEEGINLAFLGNKALAGFSFILLNISIFKGSVTLVNGLQGIQYAFVFIFTLLLSQKLPKLLKEKIGPVIIFQKILAICLIATGLIILWLS